MTIEGDGQKREPGTTEARAPEVERAVSEVERAGLLSVEQRQALASLLGASLQISRFLQGHLSEDEYSLLFLGGYAERISMDACRLAGVPLGSPRPEEPEFVHLAMEVERHTESMWSSRLGSRELKAEAIYRDGPSRPAAIATALVMLARLVLDAEKSPRAHEDVLERLLGRVMDQYDDLLDPAPTFEEKLAVMKERHAAALAKEQAEDRAQNGPEPSFHGEHVD